MQFRAILIPTTGDKAEQVFCASREEAKKWGRRTLWSKYRKLVQAATKGEKILDPVPYISISCTAEVHDSEVYPWDVTDDDKKIEGGTD